MKKKQKKEVFGRGSVGGGLVWGPLFKYVKMVQVLVMMRVVYYTTHKKSRTIR
jgi:hypothetical protein